MKKIIVLVVAVIMGTAATVNAQKIGHINTNDLLVAMPETKKAQDRLKNSQDSLNVVYAQLIKEYQEKDSVIRIDSAKWSPAIKQIRFKEFQDLADAVQQYSTSAQQFLQQKEQEFFAPVQKIALDAIQSVAKANGYAYVVSRDALLVVPTTDDLLPLVKKFLKIPETPAK
ncbi:OmpH family outer membrane protein [Lacibacter sp. H375]|uniref:OmpH family outer membrane protein n=1 Tax=Lacibacter sp. H375 TaxID=3133424 RepID=UPI0030BC3605